MKLRLNISVIDASFFRYLYHHSGGGFNEMGR